eukprot:11868694-Heterocapsa_arctica.AAC.1
MHAEAPGNKLAGNEQLHVLELGFGHATKQHLPMLDAPKAEKDHGTHSSEVHAVPKECPQSLLTHL